MRIASYFLLFTAALLLHAPAAIAQSITDAPAKVAVSNPVFEVKDQSGATLLFSVNDDGTVTCTNCVAASALADDAVTGEKIAPEAIQAGSNVTITRDASDNIVIGATGGGGSGFSLPFSGTTSSGTPAFDVENTGIGLAGRFSSGGQSALFVRGTSTQGESDAINVTATGSGVRVDADADGLLVLGAGTTPTPIPSTSNNGIEVQAAEGAGLFVGSAGGSGIIVNRSASDGLLVTRAGAPAASLSYSQLANGVEVAGAEGNGLFVGAADGNGVHVEGATGRAGYFGGDIELTGNLICTDCIGGTDIADGSVSGIDIANGSLDGNDIADATLTGNDILNGSLSGAHIQDGSIGRIDLAQNSVSGFEIVDGSVSGADVLDGTITSADVANGSLTGDDVQDGSLTLADFGGSFGELAGGAGVGGSHSPRFGIARDQASVVRSLTISAPSAGIVLAWASLGLWAVDGTAPSLNTAWAHCRLSTGTTLSQPDLFAENNSYIEFNDDELFAQTLSLTDHFAVASAGDITINLLCRESGDDVSAVRSNLTILFLPNQY